MSVAASATPRQVVENYLRSVEADDGKAFADQFADLFASDGVLEYPFEPPGSQGILEGREVIREFFHARQAVRQDSIEMREISSVIFETDDPEVVILQIDHRGVSKTNKGQYHMHAIHVIRVRDGQIVRYTDYMDPLLVARLSGRLPDLFAAMSAAD